MAHFSGAMLLWGRVFFPGWSKKKSPLLISGTQTLMPSLAERLLETEDLRLEDKSRSCCESQVGLISQMLDCCWIVVLWNIMKYYEEVIVKEADTVDGQNPASPSMTYKTLHFCQLFCWTMSWTCKVDARSYPKRSCYVLWTRHFSSFPLSFNKLLGRGNLSMWDDFGEFDHTLPNWWLDECIFGMPCLVWSLFLQENDYLADVPPSTSRDLVPLRPRRGIKLRLALPPS